MRIRIFARSFFEARQGGAKEAYWLRHYRIVSINSIVLPEMPPFTQTYWDYQNLLILFFDDHEHESDNAFSMSDAEKVLAFALQPDPRPILIHCTAGESRSGAVGLFLNKIINRDYPEDSQRFFQDYPWICEKANQLVLRRLEEAYAQKNPLKSRDGEIMLTYTVTSSDLAEADIYAIEPVASLREVLKPHQSLCIVKTPCEGCIPEMTRVMGKDRRGDPVKIYLGNASENDQGYIKCRLDKSLLSPYLYISWKQRGVHTFRLFQRRKMIAEFPDFESALAAYFPSGFIPEKSYRRNHTVFELMCRSFCRRQELKKIVILLARRCEQMRDMESKRTGKFIDSPRGMLDERRLLG